MGVGTEGRLGEEDVSAWPGACCRLQETTWPGCARMLCKACEPALPLLAARTCSSRVQPISRSASSWSIRSMAAVAMSAAEPCGEGGQMSGVDGSQCINTDHHLRP